MLVPAAWKRFHPGQHSSARSASRWHCFRATKPPWQSNVPLPTWAFLRTQEIGRSELSWPPRTKVWVLCQVLHTPCKQKTQKRTTLYGWVLKLLHPDCQMPWSVWHSDCNSPPYAYSSIVKWTEAHEYTRRQTTLAVRTWKTTCKNILILLLEKQCTGIQSDADLQRNCFY